MDTTTAPEPPTLPRAIDAVGEETLEIFAESEAYNRLLWSRLDAMNRAHGRVLEIGCGIGNLTRLIVSSPAVESVHGVDLDPAYVRRLAVDLAGLAVTATACSVEEFRPDIVGGVAEDQAYDTVVSSNVIEHLEDDVSAFRNVARMLAPGGRALMLAPAHPRLFCSLDRALSHYRRYTPERYAELARASGLELCRVQHFNPLGILGWWWNGKVLRRNVLPAGQVRLYSRIGVPVSAFLDRLNPFPCGISLIGEFLRR